MKHDGSSRQTVVWSGHEKDYNRIRLKKNNVRCSIA